MASLITCSEVISIRGPRRDRTLCDLYWTIHIRRPILKEAMEMQTRALVPELIIDVNNHPVTKGPYNGRDWKLIVDANNGPCVQSIRISEYPCYIEVVRDR